MTSEVRAEITIFINTKMNVTFMVLFSLLLLVASLPTIYNKKEVHSNLLSTVWSRVVTISILTFIVLKALNA